MQLQWSIWLASYLSATLCLSHNKGINCYIHVDLFLNQKRRSLQVLNLFVSLFLTWSYCMVLITGKVLKYWKKVNVLTSLKFVSSCISCSKSLQIISNKNKANIAMTPSTRSKERSGQDDSLGHNSIWWVMQRPLWTVQYILSYGMWHHAHTYRWKKIYSTCILKGK